MLQDICFHSSLILTRKFPLQFNYNLYQWVVFSLIHFSLLFIDNLTVQIMSLHHFVITSHDICFYSNLILTKIFTLQFAYDPYQQVVFSLIHCSLFPTIIFYYSWHSCCNSNIFPSQFASFWNVLLQQFCNAYYNIVASLRASTIFFFSF